MTALRKLQDERIGRRTVSRSDCDLMVEFKVSAGSWRASGMANFSSKGFRLEGIRYAPGSRSLWLRPMGMEPLAAAIRWSEPGVIGCEFLYTQNQQTENALRKLVAQADELLRVTR